MNQQEGLSGIVAAAHELKAPLALISHLATALRDVAILDNPEQRKLYATRIQLSAERSLRLVQGLTMAQRFEDMQQLALQFKLEPLDVSHVCRQALQEVEPLAAARDQRVKLVLPERPYIAVANRELLVSICYNLLDNAIWHNPRGGTIELRVGRHDDFVQVAVADNGPAITKKEFATLKQRLGRQSQQFSGRPGSSGLGLYIADRMLHAMGGSLGVRQRQQGMAFYARVVQSKQLHLL